MCDAVLSFKNAIPLTLQGVLMCGSVRYGFLMTISLYPITFDDVPSVLFLPLLLFMEGGERDKLGRQSGLEAPNHVGTLGLRNVELISGRLLC